MRLATSVSDFDVDRAKNLLKTNMLLQVRGDLSVTIGFVCFIS